MFDSPLPVKFVPTAVAKLAPIVDIDYFLARGDRPLLYDKLAISNTYSHAKNRNDLRPITLSKMSLPEVGFSAVAISGGGWLQSPASDGPPWYGFIILDNKFLFYQESGTNLQSKIDFNPSMDK